MLDIGIPHNAPKVKIFAYSDVHFPSIHGIGEERVDGRNAAKNLFEFDAHVADYKNRNPDIPVVVMNLGDDITFKTFYQDMYNAAKSNDVTHGVFSDTYRVIIPGNHDRRHRATGVFNASLPESVQQYRNGQDMNRSYVLRAGPLLIVHIGSPYYDDIQIDTSELKPEEREFFHDVEDAKKSIYKPGRYRGIKHYTFEQDIQQIQSDIALCIEDVEGVVVLTHVNPLGIKRTNQEDLRVNAAKTKIERDALKLKNPGIELPSTITYRGFTIFSGINQGDQLIRTVDAIDEISRQCGDKFLGHVHGHKHISNKSKRNGITTRALPSFSSAVQTPELPEPPPRGNFLEGAFRYRAKKEAFGLKLKEKSLSDIDASTFAAERPENQPKSDPELV